MGKRPEWLQAGMIYRYKIMVWYDSALELVEESVPVCDVCHTYDNSLDAPYRIFKKRKNQYWYCPKTDLWLKEKVAALTGIHSVVRKALNKQSWNETQ